MSLFPDVCDSLHTVQRKSCLTVDEHSFLAGAATDPRRCHLITDRRLCSWSMCTLLTQVSNPYPGGGEERPSVNAGCIHPRAQRSLLRIGLTLRRRRTTTTSSSKSFVICNGKLLSPVRLWRGRAAFPACRPFAHSSGAQCQLVMSGHGGITIQHAKSVCNTYCHCSDSDQTHSFSSCAGDAWTLFLAFLLLHVKSRNGMAVPQLMAADPETHGFRGCTCMWSLADIGSRVVCHWALYHLSVATNFEVRHVLVRLSCATRSSMRPGRSVGFVFTFHVGSTN